MNARDYVLTADDPARAMVRVVARRCGYRASDLTGPSRLADLVNVRRALALELARRGWSQAAIGEVLGGRNHTTVLYYFRRLGNGDPANLAHYRALIRPVVRLLPPVPTLRLHTARPCARCETTRTRRPSGLCWECAPRTCEVCGGPCSKSATRCQRCYVDSARWAA